MVFTYLSFSCRWLKCVQRQTVLCSFDSFSDQACQWADCFITNSVELVLLVLVTGLVFILCFYASWIFAYVTKWTAQSWSELSIRHTSATARVIASNVKFDSITDGLIDRMRMRWLILSRMTGQPTLRLHGCGGGSDDDECACLFQIDMLALGRKWEMNNDKCKKWAV